MMRWQTATDQDKGRIWLFDLHWTYEFWRLTAGRQNTWSLLVDILRKSLGPVRFQRKHCIYGLQSRKVRMNILSSEFIYRDPAGVYTGTGCNQLGLYRPALDSA